MSPDGARVVLVAGAACDAGGRLFRALKHRGARARCLARRPEILAGRVNADTELVQGDVLDTRTHQTDRTVRPVAWSGTLSWYVLSPARSNSFWQACCAAWPASAHKGTPNGVDRRNKPPDFAVNSTVDEMRFAILDRPKEEQANDQTEPARTMSPVPICGNGSKRSTYWMCCEGPARDCGLR